MPSSSQPTLRPRTLIRSAKVVSLPHVWRSFSPTRRAKANGCSRMNATARREHFKLLEFMTQIFAEGNPAGIKEACRILGLCGNQHRLPLWNVSEATARRIYQAMADAEVVKL